LGFKITASDFATPRSLSVDETGVEFSETAPTSGKRRLRFDEIDCVLLSPKGLLSLQAGGEILTIPTRRDDRAHQEAIDALVRGLKGDVGGSAQGRS
jgi:hypothetical protein